MVQQRELTLQDYITILRRRWMFIAALAVVGCLLGFIAARLLPKRYTSQTSVLVQQPGVSSDLVKPVVSDDDNQRLASMQQQILSRSSLEPVIRELGLYGDEINRVPADVLVERLRSQITITPIQAMAETRAQNLPGFTISVVFNDPKLAQQICARITSMFLVEHVQQRRDQGDQTTQFLVQQLQEAKGKLDEQDAKLASFKRRYLGSLPDETQANLNLLSGLTTQLEASTQALARAQQDKGFAESVLSQQISSAQATQSGKNPETLETQLSAMQAQLVTLRSKYTSDHPDVLKQEHDIEEMRKKVAEAEQRSAAGTDKPAKAMVETSQVQQLRAQIHQYDQVIKERSSQQEEIQRQIRLYQGRVQSSPGVEQEYKQLTRDYQTALEGYNDLLKKRDQSSIANDLEKSQQGEQFRVLDAANFPSTPSFPKPPLFLGGGLAAGLALGIGLTLFLEMQDTSLRTERDVELALHLPVLASIPIIAYDAKPSKGSRGLLGTDSPSLGT